MSQLHDLINLLSTERVPVAQLWRDLGITRADLGELIKRHRAELGREGIMLHVATVSQASNPRLHIETDEQRVASLSRPASAPARHVSKYLESVQANPYELREIKAIVEAQLADAQQAEQPQADAQQADQGAHMIYRQEYVKCGKPTCTKCSEGAGHGPYWYSYKRDNGKLKKKYIGKQKPTEA